MHGVDEWLLVGRDVAAIQLLLSLKFAENNSNRSAEMEFDVSKYEIGYTRFVSIAANWS